MSRRWQSVNPATPLRAPNWLAMMNRSTAPPRIPRRASSACESWTMLDNIRNFFARTMRAPRTEAGDADSEAEERHRLHVAACALLLELAHADDEFTPAERAHVEAVVRRHLDLDEETARGLLDLAEQERKNAIDLYQFTSLIRENYDLGQKTLLAEIMWGVVLADGQIGQHESYMLRKIANLLDLKPGYLSAARKRVSGEESHE
jgi:uncharacterized tellurite resistance protein B-like protein